MSDDEKELEEGEGTLNPDIIDASLGDDDFEDDVEVEGRNREDGDLSIDEVADDEDAAAGESDVYDDRDLL
jgi:hypothetical protein